MAEKFQIEITRSNRRSICIQVKNGVVQVRAPMHATDWDVEDIVEHHRERLELLLRAQRQGAAQPLSSQELRELADRAKAVIPQKVAHYAALLGVTYGRITIRNQRTKWGSCSAKGNLNFNCLLMLAPEKVLDAVIVHELCHRKEMNHSPAFYREVRRVMPDYDEWNRWLKDNGPLLMERMRNLND